MGTATEASSLVGNDDTVASMGYGLSGAYLGEEAIPMAAQERAEGAEALLGLTAGTPMPLGR